MKKSSEKFMDELSEHHEKRIGSAQTSGHCDEYIGPHPDGRVDGGVHFGPILHQCSNAPLANDHQCAYHKDLVEEQGMSHCYGCGALYPSVVASKWVAQKGRDEWWLIWAVMPCCGRQANTEHVAQFVGEYHDAEKNANAVVDAHNAALGPAYESWKIMRAKVKARLAENRPITDAEARELWPDLMTAARLSERTGKGK